MAVGLKLVKGREGGVRGVRGVLGSAPLSSTLDPMWTPCLAEATNHSPLPLAALLAPRRPPTDFRCGRTTPTPTTIMIFSTLQIPQASPAATAVQRHRGIEVSRSCRHRLSWCPSSFLPVSFFWPRSDSHQLSVRGFKSQPP